MITLRSALFGTVCTVVFALLVSWKFWPFLLLDAALIVGAAWKEKA